MIRKLLVALALFAAGDAVRAHVPCAVDPQVYDAEACDVAGRMSGYGRMTGQLLDAIEILRALASRNPQFGRAYLQLPLHRRRDGVRNDAGRLHDQISRQALRQ